MGSDRSKNRKLPSSQPATIVVLRAMSDGSAATAGSTSSSSLSLADVGARFLAIGLEEWWRVAHHTAPPYESVTNYKKQAQLGEQQRNVGEADFGDKFDEVPLDDSAVCAS